MLPDVLLSPLGQVSLAIFVVYGTWWTWAFIIKPALNPQDPKQYPYLIPFVGHAIAFAQDSDTVFSKARRYFGNTRTPFAITAAGQVFYIVTSPEDTSAIYRNTKTLTFDEFIQDMLKTLGVSADGIRQAFPTGIETKPLPYYGQEIYRAHFLPGDGLPTLWGPLQTCLLESLSFDNIPKDAVLAAPNGSEKLLSLWKWTRATLIKSVTETMFGHALLQMQPDLVSIFAAFDDSSWKLMHKYPKYAAKDAHAALAKLQVMLSTYLDLPADKRGDVAPVIKELEAKFREFGLAGEDLARTFVMPLWVINSNSYKLCFWVLALLLQDQSLLDTIKAEIAEAMKGDKSGLGARLEHCTRLVAAYHEVLRLTASTASIRGIATDTMIGGVVLRAGNKVMIPYRQLHMDEAAWGSDAQTFKAERFVSSSSTSSPSATKDLTRSPSFRPFGGGNTLCTGRHIAMREVLTFVAIAIQHLEVDLPLGTRRSVDRVMAKVDLAMPTLGVLPPLPGQDIEVVVKRIERQGVGKGGVSYCDA